MSQESPSDLDKLHFYRDEVKHEFNLLAMRVNVLVTCQSFLVVPFAILNTVAHFRVVYWATLAVAALGIYTAWIIREPIEAAHRTIGYWLLKHRALLKTSATLADFRTPRDDIEGVDRDLSRDRDHQKSLAFSKHAPRAFIIFWIAAIVGVSVRCYLGR